MKKFIFLFTLLLSSFFLLAFSPSIENNFPLFGYTILIDAGHGGEDPGSVYMDEYEKDYNLMFSNSLKIILEEYGANVVMVRGGDYDLSSPNVSRRKRSDFNNRIKLIDDSGSDMFISLHMNYLNDSKYYGAQTFFDDNNSANKTIASIMQKNFNQFFSFNKDIKKLDNTKYMYQRIKTKGVLIEFGFISNTTDRQNLKNEEYRERLADVIAKSIIEYFT